MKNKMYCYRELLGKTTTTSLVGNVLLETGKLDPTIVNGGIINSISETTNLAAKVIWMVVSRQMRAIWFILKLPHPNILITNLDIEHLDYYNTSKNLISAFEKFIINLPFYGVAIINEDDSNLRKIISKNDTRKIISYSNKNKNADVFINKIIFEKNTVNFN